MGRHRASFLGRTRCFSKPHVVVAARVSVAHSDTTFNVVLTATAFACVALTYMSNRRRSWSTRLDVLTVLYEGCSDRKSCMSATTQISAEEKMERISLYFNWMRVSQFLSNSKKWRDLSSYLLRYLLGALCGCLSFRHARFSRWLLKLMKAMVAPRGYALG